MGVVQQKPSRGQFCPNVQAPGRSGTTFPPAGTGRTRRSPVSEGHIALSFSQGSVTKTVVGASPFCKSRRGGREERGFSFACFPVKD